MGTARLSSEISCGTLSKLTVLTELMHWGGEFEMYREYEMVVCLFELGYLGVCRRSFGSSDIRARGGGGILNSRSGHFVMNPSCFRRCGQRRVRSSGVENL